MTSKRTKAIRDVGWLVGIIEGEGSFTLGFKSAGKRQNYYPVIQITNTNRGIIDKAVGVLESLGLTCHVYAHKPPRDGLKTYWRIEIGGNVMVNKALVILLPLIECRQEQALALADYVALRLSKRSHSPLGEDEHKAADRLRRLNGNKRLNVPSPDSTLAAMK